MAAVAERLPDGLSILMPVYNEIERIERALDATLAVKLPCPFELVIVDDGSTDGTVDYLRNRQLARQRPRHLPRANQGKGAAVRTALADARLRFSAIFDADLEYDPDDLAVLLEPLRRGKGVNVVFGVRTFDGYTSHSFLFVMGNKSVTLAANVLFNVYIHDLMTCHKAMYTEIFRSLPLARTDSASSPRSRRACCSAASGSTRCPSTTGRAPRTRGRSSPRSTASACSGRCCGAASPKK